MAEPAELQQVLLNLVTNASHSMRDGGVVTIRVDVRAGGADLQDTLLQQSERVAVLTVADTGSGMSSETLARVFEPFFTTKRPGHGTGLGLATVHATVTGMGGVVRGESTLGVGTRMAVLLPAVAPAAAVVSHVVAPRARHVDGPAQHIVVVDDEPAVLLATSRLIERLGFLVTRYDTPERLLQELDTLEPAPAMIMTDLSMPVLSGWELASRVHAKRPSLPIVVMTGNLELSDNSPAGHPGVSGILSKPFTTPELRDMLQQCLKG
jgi:CheY-like chemotaxis protein